MVEPAMRTKRGVLCLTPELLHAALGLPRDIEIEHVFESPPSHVGLRINLVLTGDALPVAPAAEGQILPMVYGKYTMRDNKITWIFREG